MAHFMPCKKRSAGIVQNFSSRRLCDCRGCQKAITISRDTRYLSNFLQTLWKKKATKLQYSSTYQPQKDGKTEVENQNIENLLKFLAGDKLK